VPNIPIIIDDIKQLDGFDMTRCVYFHIECEDTLDPWVLGVGGTQTPFLMLGLSGIIIQPIEGGIVFTSPQQLEELFSFIEGLRREDRDEAHMNVEIADVWLPNRMLGEQRRVARGDVYRVDLDLFQSAMAFTAGRLDYEAFRGRTLERRHEVFFTEQETKVIQGWALYEIRRSRDSRHPDLYLPSRERDR
jgi:hypothetical protein